MNKDEIINDLKNKNNQLNKELNVLAIENVNLYNQNRKLIDRLSELENKRANEKYLYNDIFIERKNQ